MLKPDEILKLCKAVLLSLGDGVSYQDEVMTIEKNSEGLEIMLKAAYNPSSECDNPVLMADPNGKVYRYHGEITHLEAHLIELVKECSISSLEA